MTNKQVLFQRIVSADGRSVAEARSEAIAFGNNGAKITQFIQIKTTLTQASSSSSSSSSSKSQ
jgi:hypothetical protein